MLLGSTALDVAIGLVFIYLVVSLICSALNEGVEAWLNHRSQDLERGICEMLTGTSSTDAVSTFPNPKAVDPAAAAPAAGALPPAAAPPAVVPPAAPPAPAAVGGTTATKIDIVQAIYDHPLISSLFKGDYSDAKKNSQLPSYIPARNFSQALLDTIRTATAAENTPVARLAADPAAAVAQLRAAAVAFHQFSPRISDALVALIDDAGDDVNKARQNIEQWFNNSMERVSGWYKRRAQYFIIAFGLAIAAAANIDTVAIVKALSTEGGVRDGLVAQASAYAAKQAPNPPPTGSTTPAPASPSSSAEDLKGAVQKLGELGLPIGWDFKKYNPSQKCPALPAGSPLEPGCDYSWFYKIFGIFLTGIAVSLGAPFWFDVLNRFVAVRASVKPPDKTPPAQTPPTPPKQ